MRRFLVDRSLPPDNEIVRSVASSSHVLVGIYTVAMHASTCAIGVGFANQGSRLRRGLTVQVAECVRQGVDDITGDQPAFAVVIARDVSRQAVGVRGQAGSFEGGK